MRLQPILLALAAGCAAQTMTGADPDDDKASSWASVYVEPDILEGETITLMDNAGGDWTWQASDWNLEWALGDRFYRNESVTYQAADGTVVPCEIGPGGSLKLQPAQTWDDPFDFAKMHYTPVGKRGECPEGEIRLLVTLIAQFYIQHIRSGAQKHTEAHGFAVGDSVRLGPDDDYVIMAYGPYNYQVGNFCDAGPKMTVLAFNTSRSEALLRIEEEASTRSACLLNSYKSTFVWGDARALQRLE